MGIPVTGVTTSFGVPAGVTLAIVAWTAIAVVNIAFNRSRS